MEQPSKNDVGAEKSLLTLPEVANTTTNTTAAAAAAAVDGLSKMRWKGGGSPELSLRRQKVGR